MARLPLPATTLQSLKGGLHAHAPAILLDDFASGWPIRNQKPGLFIACFPHRSQLRFVLMRLPEPHRNKPRLTARTEHLRTALPVVKVAVTLTLKVRLLFDAQVRVPAVGLTHLDEFDTTQATISHQDAIGFP